MASSKTGQLAKEFLDNANTIPSSDSYAANRTGIAGSSTPDTVGTASGRLQGRSAVQIGRGNQRVINRQGKGNATHSVLAAGAPTVVRNPAFVSSSEKSKGKRKEVTH